MLLTACAGYNQSSVPNTPVNLDVDTRIYTFLNPGNTCMYITVDKAGYHMPDGSLFRRAPELGHYYGYAGVLLVNGLDGRYAAYDLCCPKCLSALNPIEPDSYARSICPKCGEEYDTMNSGEGGTGFPTKGICKEGLKRYFVSYNNYIIRINNQ